MGDQASYLPPARDGTNQAGSGDIDLRLVRHSVSLQAPVDLLGIYLSQFRSPVHRCKGELKLAPWSHNRRAERVRRHPTLRDQIGDLI